VPGVAIWTFEPSARSVLGDAVAWVEDEYGCLDVLVNDAAFGHRGLERARTQERRIDIEADAICLQDAVDVLVSRASGPNRCTIVNLSSGLGELGLSIGSVCPASAIAVEGLLDAIAEASAAFGLAIKLVDPDTAPTRPTGDQIARAVYYASTDGTSRLRYDASDLAGAAVQSLERYVGGATGDGIIARMRRPDGRKGER
jgi:NAD(P)-dependent dehydrogenase (short-subunit alcohol dehydrogenase family)